MAVLIRNATMPEPIQERQRFKAALLYRWVLEQGRYLVYPNCTLPGGELAADR